MLSVLFYLVIALVPIGAVWFIVCLLSLGRPVPPQQRRAYIRGSLIFAIIFTFLTAVFAVWTLRNPYPDIEKWWTTNFAIGSAVSALGHWVMIAPLRRRLRNWDRDPPL